MSQKNVRPAQKKQKKYSKPKIRKHGTISPVVQAQTYY